MPTIPQVTQAMQTVLTSGADSAAHTTQFVQRASKLTGAGFVQTLVFGFLANPQATRAQLAATAAALGVEITPQGLDQRLTEAGADCLSTVLDVAAASLVSADPLVLPVLSRFTGVILQDSTTISLPRTLARIWLGSGNQNTRGQAVAALKLGVRLNLTDGSLDGPSLDHGRTSDRQLHVQHLPIPVGALRLADLGFFDLAVLRQIEREHGFWLGRLPVSTAVFLPDGERLALLDWLTDHDGAIIDQAVLVGARQRLPARLMAVRVPQEVADQRRRRLRAEAKRRGTSVSARALALAAWTVLITNVPVERLSVAEALVLMRTRWQIELLFRLWKSQYLIDRWRSGRPWAILCELYAKVLGMIVHHWLLLVSCWEQPDRSLAKASGVLRQHVIALASACTQPERLIAAIETLRRCIRASCRINKRRSKPHTYQLLIDLAEARLA